MPKSNGLDEYSNKSLNAHMQPSSRRRMSHRGDGDGDDEDDLDDGELWAHGNAGDSDEYLSDGVLIVYTCSDAVSSEQYASFGILKFSGFVSSFLFSSPIAHLFIFSNKLSDFRTIISVFCADY
jgi:hypothetical protein